MRCLVFAVFALCAACGATPPASVPAADATPVAPVSSSSSTAGTDATNSGSGATTAPTASQTTNGGTTVESTQGIPGCDLSNAQAVTDVTLNASGFDPNCVTLTLDANQTASLTITNADTVPRDVIAVAGQGITLDSGEIDAGSDYTATFTSPGGFTLALSDAPDTRLMVFVVVQ